MNNISSASNLDYTKTAHHIDGLDKNVDLTALNTLALHSCSSEYLAITDVAQIEPAVHYAQQQGLNLFVLSGGSNVLLPAHMQTLTLHMQNKGQEILTQNQHYVEIKVQAGEIWHDFVCACCAQGYHGLENLALIPGYVGASPIQNIGAYGVEVGEFIQQIWAYDIQQQQHVVLSQSQCQFSYRDSLFKQQAGRYIIYAVSFRLLRQAQLKLTYADLAQRVGVNASAEKLLHAIIAIRTEKLPQPSQYPNVGSFFKNPILNQQQFAEFIQHYPQAPHYPQADGTVKIAAGWLIEQAGWKGKKINNVGMFERQALVLVNYGGADLAQVKQTYHQVQADIWQKFAILLQPEPVLLDQFGQIQAHTNTNTNTNIVK